MKKLIFKKQSPLKKPKNVWRVFVFNNLLLFLKLLFYVMANIIISTFNDS